ncbi:epididymal-specific lipocalin-12 isoform X3 [Otolemur garnettii]|uniref:epididymal-specific lipocalin-12 isoform X3 n=1 Tax=Otolemur garnettii TaxID=30611 RepID=UPI000643F6D1|nr:epididymal-specific lipocalin-12 isoform X3 [Otolemur garnettii]
MQLWCTACLLLTLLDILWGQTLSTQPVPSPSQMQSFQAEQFQGEWLVLGLASNTFQKEHRALLRPFTTTFELTPDGHFKVSNAMTRLSCPPRSPAWPAVGGEDQGPTLQRLVLCAGPSSPGWTLHGRPQCRQTSSLTVVRISLLGRNWTLPTGMMDKFLCLGRTQGLSERNVAFPDLAGNRAQDGIERVGPRW